MTPEHRQFVEQERQYAVEMAELKAGNIRARHGFCRHKVYEHDEGDDSKGKSIGSAILSTSSASS
jgi:hypothetical protein